MRHFPCAGLVALVLSGCHDVTGPLPSGGVSYERPDYSPQVNPGASTLSIPEIHLRQNDWQPVEAPEQILNSRAFAAIEGVIIHPDSRVKGSTAILEVFVVRRGKEVVVGSQTAQLTGDDGRLHFHIQFDHSSLKKGLYRWRLQLFTSRFGKDPSKDYDEWIVTAAEGNLRKL